MLRVYLDGKNMREEPGLPDMWLKVLNFEDRGVRVLDVPIPPRRAIQSVTHKTLGRGGWLLRVDITTKVI